MYNNSEELLLVLYWFKLYKNLKLNLNEGLSAVSES